MVIRIDAGLSKLSVEFQFIFILLKLVALVREVTAYQIFLLLIKNV
jgi:hypothetical protein